ncbi:MAG: hypothetical protein M3Q81_04800 [bacterium]|nr:hypothetical protein [bacterium]
MQVFSPFFIILLFITLITSAALTYTIVQNNHRQLLGIAIRTAPSAETITIDSPINESSPSSSPSPSPAPSPKLTAVLDNSYTKTKASIFWVGEASDASNAFIANDRSAWDTGWQESFGGVDDPDNRCGFNPCDFTPLENPFYFALPYNDLDRAGNRKDSARLVPWFAEKQQLKSVIKNSWVEFRRIGTTCYAQWQDVGPLESDDFEYVFGDAQPKNLFGVKAGIDVSPAVRDCLKMTTNEMVSWRFVDEADVPAGPWKQIITTSPVNWTPPEQR